MSGTYQSAGVNLDVAEELTERITQRLQNRLFGGFVPVSELKSYRQPVLVSSIDGVGTKARLAAHLDRVEGLGKDIVHHCVNDIAIHGAKPIFFMDCLAFNRLDAGMADRLVASISSACEALDVRLAGGETEEMPAVYRQHEFTVIGAIVGAVEQDRIIDGSAIAEGDLLLGLPSSGLHTNGYSLVQELFSTEDYSRYEPSLGKSLGEALLEPHRCYLPEIRSLLGSGSVHGMAHITGGGIETNLARIMPADLDAVVELPPLPPLFGLIQARGVAEEEMRKVFNLGIGLIAVCDPSIEITSEEFMPMGRVERSRQDEKRRVRFGD